MLKKIVALLILVFSVYLSFRALMPSSITDLNTSSSKFSTERALTHLKEISKQTHYVGSDAHAEVRNYIIQQLNVLGIPNHVQEGFSMTGARNVTKSKNIIAKIKGRESGKALLLLTHYDCVQFSLGASDAGTGIVTILEGIRAFLNNNNQPKNDIIIMFSDAEEIGLNGAKLFVKNHEFAKDVGFVLNFESRGSGGPSYMLLETNGGNSEFIKAFANANVQYPVANSLAYSIYKKLPNDTDLTIFRRDGNIDGFNFAFVDNHFDYHTELDTVDRLDQNTLEHQGSYLMPLLNYFAEADLDALKSKSNYIYFNVPFLGVIIYPFSWIIPMLCIAGICFIALLIFGFKKDRLKGRDIFKGFLAFLSSLIICGSVSFFGWKLILQLYPEYKEILQGFTYNGHTYIWLFFFLALGICFLIYNKVCKTSNSASLLVAPLTIWITVCILMALYLPGGSFFIILVFFGLIAFFILLLKDQPDPILLAALSIPLLFIMSPYVKMFYVGLGLNALYLSIVFVVLIFGLLIPLFGYFDHKKRWAYLFFFLGGLAFLFSHLNSDFTAETPKPNSLIYTLNTETNEAHWATYDYTLDEWTKNKLGENPTNREALKSNTITNKYLKRFTYTQKAKLKDIPKSNVEISYDTIIQNRRHLSICISPQRDVKRIEVLADSTNLFHAFKINGIDASRGDKREFVLKRRRRGRLCQYFVADDEPLELFLTVPKDQKIILDLHETSYDLLTNPDFLVPKRNKAMISKPFVLNNAVVLRSKIVLEKQ